MPAMAFDTLQEEARDQLPGAIKLRRDLHRHPEIGNILPRTRERLLADLDGLGLDLTLHERTSGVAGLLTGAKPGPTILLRGDMDALPMPEHTGLDFASEVEGRDARLRSRHPRGDAGRCRSPPRRPSGRHDRPGAVHVPARRGGSPRCPPHAGGGPARRTATGRRHAEPGRRRRRHPHQLRPADRLGEHPRGSDHGVVGRPAHRRDRAGRPRLRAPSRARSRSDRL